jgi:hypothetical protein
MILDSSTSIPSSQGIEFNCGKFCDHAPQKVSKKMGILLQEVSPEGLPETADKHQILCTIKLDKKRNFLQTL